MALTPENALRHLDNAASKWVGPRSDHQTLSESVSVIAQQLHRLDELEGELAKVRTELEALRGDPPTPEDKG